MITATLPSRLRKAAPGFGRTYRAARAASGRLPERDKELVGREVEYQGWRLLCPIFESESHANPENGSARSFRNVRCVVQGTRELF